VQTCVVHLVRNSLRFASRKYWKPIADHLKQVDQALTVKAAEQRFDDFAKEWEPTYSATVAMWRRAWGEVTPVLDYPLEIRKLIYTTNGIESLNARFRRRTGVEGTSRTSSRH
jgi:putative transposase